MPWAAPAPISIPLICLKANALPMFHYTGQRWYNFKYYYYTVIYKPLHVLKSCGEYRKSLKTSPFKSGLYVSFNIILIHRLHTK